MKLTGIPASQGYGIGNAYIIKNFLLPVSKPIKNTEEEIKRFRHAVIQANNELEAIYLSKKELLGEENAGIFKAHIAMLNDPELASGIIKHIQKKECAEYATKIVTDQYYNMFSIIEDDYLRERAIDIKDIGLRLMKILTGVATKLEFTHHKPLIIISKNLTPSDTANLNPNLIAGIITETGGATSHSAIIARTLGIPAVMGINDATQTIKSDQLLVIDGYDGQVTLSPNKNFLKLINEKIQLDTKEQSLLKEFKNKPSQTKDGIAIEISSNITSPDDLDYVLESGSDGIGLFRSEFIYMNRPSAPTEDEQYLIYKKVLQQLKGKPVLIRTLDVGGDKNIPYLNIPKEINPFLGYRGIRYCLNNPHLFKSQIRALLRAGIYGKLRIMFPMISSLEELRNAKSLVSSCKKELFSQGIPYDEKPEIGIMIEVPSAAIISDILAKEVDFFSIGTNDLIQYTVAVDRMNNQINHLYSPYHPALIRLIKTIIDNGHKNNIWVGMCGGLASNPKMIPLLINLGLDEFSMNPSAVLKSRKIVSETTKENHSFVANILAASTANKVEQLLSTD